MTKIATKKSFRYGKVCAKHPGLNGKRYCCNNLRVECAKNHSRAAHAKRTMTVPQELTMLRSQLRDAHDTIESLRASLRVAQAMRTEVSP